MMNAHEERSQQSGTASLKHLVQERLMKTRELIFRRRQRERLEYDRRRAAEQPRDLDARELVARCPSCGHVLDRAVVDTNS
jgi:hypothetical protein